MPCAGDILSLRFAAEEFASDETLPSGNKGVYVTLKEDTDGFAVVDRVSADRIEGDNVIHSDRFGFTTRKRTSFSPSTSSGFRKVTLPPPSWPTPRIAVAEKWMLTSRCEFAMATRY